MSSQILQEAFFTDYHEEAAQILETFQVPEILRLMQSTTGKNAANLLACMNPVIATEVLMAMSTDLLVRTLPQMSPGIAASLLQRLDKALSTAILNRIPERHANEIRSYMEYPKDSVGSLMDPRVFTLPEDLSVEEAIAQVRNNAPRDIHDVYIVDRNQILVGKLSVRDLMLIEPDERLQSVMHRDVSAIYPYESREQMVEEFSQRLLFTIPVIDLDGHLLGVIRNQDIIKASQEDATADMLTMVGANKDERPLSPVSFSVRKRLPWLLINLGTAFLAAFVVGIFESTIARFTALAVLLPVVAGQSGNTGAQSLAVVLRGLALRDIRPSDWLRVSGKEIYVAFLNGLAIAVAACLAVLIWSRSFGLTFIIGISMIMAMVVAGLAGAVIPIVLKALNQDPAQSSSIVLTTVTDVFGFLSFLGLATMFASILET